MGSGFYCEAFDLATEGLQVELHSMSEIYTYSKTFLIWLEETYHLRCSSLLHSKNYMYFRQTKKWINIFVIHVT